MATPTGPAGAGQPRALRPRVLAGTALAIGLLSGLVAARPPVPSSLEQGVTAAAARWAEAAQRCEPLTREGAVLFGSPELAEGLCATRGTPALGPVGPLPDVAEARVLRDAFGPGVTTWARTVRVLSPVAFDAVLAPAGDGWEVIAILPPG